MNRPLRAAALAALLCLPLLGAAPAAAATSVKITLKCYSNPEKTTITNNGTVTFKVTKVGSTYHPYSSEPFSVSKTLAPGQSVTYQTGNAASGAYELSHLYIYNNNGQDGVGSRLQWARSRSIAEFLTSAGRWPGRWRRLLRLQFRSPITTASAVTCGRPRNAPTREIRSHIRSARRAPGRHKSGRSRSRT